MWRTILTLYQIKHHTTVVSCGQTYTSNGIPFELCYKILGISIKNQITKCIKKIIYLVRNMSTTSNTQTLSLPIPDHTSTPSLSQNTPQHSFCYL